MAPSTTKAEDLAILKSTVETTLELITKLSDFSESSTEDKPTDVNALDLANDTASLIRAHSTKLSLLIINKPFTPSAIAKVLRELVAGPLPGLASSVELCNAAKYTKTLSAELKWHAKKVFREFGVLVRAIPLDGNILSEDAKNGTGKTEGKGSLASTGVVWQACDGVIELKKLGVAGVVIKMAEDYRELIEDALWELQEWGELTSDADEEDPVSGSGDEEDAQAAFDNMFEAQKHIPVEDPDKIRPRFESSVKRLRLVTLMYQAVVKRRFKTLPPLPHPVLPSELKAKSSEDSGIVSTLDEVMDILKKIPEITDELATAFYSLDGVEIDKRMKECFFTGFAAVELLIKNWEGENDEFTIWVSALNHILSMVLILKGLKIPACHEERLVICTIPTCVVLHLNQNYNTHNIRTLQKPAPAQKYPFPLCYPHPVCSILSVFLHNLYPFVSLCPLFPYSSLLRSKEISLSNSSVPSFQQVLNPVMSFLQRQEQCTIKMPNLLLRATLSPEQRLRYAQQQFASLPTHWNRVYIASLDKVHGIDSSEAIKVTWPLDPVDLYRATEGGDDGSDRNGGSDVDGGRERFEGVQQGGDDDDPDEGQDRGQEPQRGRDDGNSEGEQTRNQEPQQGGVLHSPASGNGKPQQGPTTDTDDSDAGEGNEPSNNSPNDYLDPDELYSGDSGISDDTDDSDSLDLPSNRNFLENLPKVYADARSKPMKPTSNGESPHPNASDELGPSSTDSSVIGTPSASRNLPDFNSSPPMGLSLQATASTSDEDIPPPPNILPGTSPAENSTLQATVDDFFASLEDELNYSAPVLPGRLSPDELRTMNRVFGIFPGDKGRLEGRGGLEALNDSNPVKDGPKGRYPIEDNGAPVLNPLPKKPKEKDPNPPLNDREGPNPAPPENDPARSNKKGNQIVYNTRYVQLSFNDVKSIIGNVDMSIYEPEMVLLEVFPKWWKLSLTPHVVNTYVKMICRHINEMRVQDNKGPTPWIHHPAEEDESLVPLNRPPDMSTWVEDSRNVDRFGLEEEFVFPEMIASLAPPSPRVDPEDPWVDFPSVATIDINLLHDAYEWKLEEPFQRGVTQFPGLDIPAFQKKNMEQLDYIFVPDLKIPPPHDNSIPQYVPSRNLF